MKETCEKCSTIGCCPFSFNDELERVQNHGCLPSPMEIVNMRIIYNKTWACHLNSKKPCLGTLLYLKKKNLPFKVVDKELLTEDSNWSLYIN